MEDKFSDLELAAAKSKSAQNRMVLLLVSILALGVVALLLLTGLTEGSQKARLPEDANRYHSPNQSAIASEEIAETKDNVITNTYPVTPEQKNAAEFLLSDPALHDQASAYLTSIKEGTQTGKEREVANGFVDEQIKFEIQLNDKLAEGFSAINSVLVSRLLLSLPAEPQSYELLQHWYSLSGSLSDYTKITNDYKQAIGAQDQLGELQHLISLDKLTPDVDFFGKRIAKIRRDLLQQKKAIISTQLSKALSSEAIFDFKAISVAEKKVINSDSKLRELKMQVELSNESKRRKSLEKKLTVLAKSDNWSQIKTLSNGLTTNLITENSESLISTAGSILDLQSKFQSLINTPKRLSDYRVQEFANSLFEQQRVFEGLSPTLEEQSVKLQSLMIEAQRPLTVLILSDSKAQILIPRVGIVAPTERKEIMLKPGLYRFIGRCKGASDNEVSVIIDEVNMPIVVEVRCGSSLN